MLLLPLCLGLSWGITRRPHLTALFDGADDAVGGDHALRDEWLPECQNRFVLDNYQSLHEGNDEAKALNILRGQQEERKRPTRTAAN